MRPGSVVAWLAAGAGLSLVAVALLAPIAGLADLDESAQEVSRTVEQAGGVGLVLLLVTVALVSPVVEELLFRGVLLRALQSSPPSTWPATRARTPSCRASSCSA
jgi:membrane protease YdiL (CAAX protease family)